MFSALDFMYDGIYSGNYGLKIASFDNNALKETPYITPDVVVTKSSRGTRFFYEGIKYNAPPTLDFSILSETPIHDGILSEILSWLDSRKGFRELVIFQSYLDETKYNCIFTIKDIIYHGGSCIGLNITATFDSIYQYGIPIVREFICSYGVDDNFEPIEFNIYNNTEAFDEYTYPIVEFTTLDGNIEIVNKTDDVNRVFKFSNLQPNSILTIDNEIKTIESDINELCLDKFDGRNWMRLVKGNNEIEIKLNGIIKITVPQRIKIRY